MSLSSDHGSLRLTPDDAEQDYRSGAPPQYANPNLLPPEYYTPGNYPGGDQYDSRRGQTRRVPASVSSSDNNSDTTYAESGDINNSLRARMQALDNRKFGRLLRVNEQIMISQWGKFSMLFRTLKIRDENLRTLQLKFHLLSTVTIYVQLHDKCHFSF